MGKSRSEPIEPFYGTLAIVPEGSDFDFDAAVERLRRAFLRREVRPVAAGRNRAVTLAAGRWQVRAVLVAQPQVAEYPWRIEFQGTDVRPGSRCHADLVRVCEVFASFGGVFVGHLTLLPVFGGDDLPDCTIGEGYPALYRARRSLHAAAAAGGLRSLDEFLCPGEGDADELARFGVDEGPFPPERWFTPAEGRAAVRALAVLLRSRPRAVPWQAAVLAELASLEAELEACTPNVWFHLTLAP